MQADPEALVVVFVVVTMVAAAVWLFIRNAQAFLATVQEFGTFNNYIWSFVGGQPKQNAWASIKEVPAQIHARRAAVAAPHPSRGRREGTVLAIRRLERAREEVGDRRGVPVAAVLALFQRT